MSLDSESQRRGPGHVFLVGFMGSGKSTVGPLLAHKLSRQFLDLDDVIGTRTGKSIAEIFSESGEAAFRRFELEAIQSIARIDAAVIALGGGAFGAEENRALIERVGLSVWLDCPLELCLARIRGDASRPLLGTDAQMESLLAARLPAYRKAKLVVQTGEMTPAQIADRIVALIADSV
jgi:shikimate kinase